MIIMSVGALIITYNEEDMLREALESISWADEIVVVDSYSDDNTREIASEYTDKVFTREFDNFSAQRNHGLEKIESDWIFVLDADERVSEDLRLELLAVIEENGCDLYEIPRKNYFLGKWIKYGGWYPDYTPRLFRNKFGIRYIGEVHEKPDFVGETGKLKNDLIHYTYKDITSYISKVNHYTSLSAIKSSKNPSIFYVMFRPIIEFFKVYLFKKAFLLGREGLILAMVSSISKFLKYAKLWEKSN